MFGTQLASSCVSHTFHGTQFDGRGKTLEPADELSAHSSGGDFGLIFEAYLPHASADVDIIITKGAFFSVDSRPVTSTRGTFKKIYASFKTHLSRSIRGLSSGQKDKLPAPFIRLDIRCPPGSYNPNIEPSKDDVLFRDEAYIINRFEDFISLIYPTTMDEPNEPSNLPVPTVSGRGVSQSGFTVVPGPNLSIQVGLFY